MQKNCCKYPVEFVKDAFGESKTLAELLKTISCSENPRVLIVADYNVVQRNPGLGSKVGRYVQAHGITLAASPVVISGGEKIKADNLQTALKVVSAMLSAKLGRNDVVLAIGGGSILDVVGYAASQVRGGIKMVRMPTTPCSMMGAAFANYAAVDSASIKDALRVPSEPAAVVVDVSFAPSVLDGVWGGGISEAVRQAVAQDATLFKKLVKLAPNYNKRDIDAIAEVTQLVYESRQKKGASSFALWSAFRLESMSGYKLPQGYAIAIGICLDLDYAVASGSMKVEDRDAVVELLRSCGALDGMDHSRHLICQIDKLMLGIDAWMLSRENKGIVIPKGIGKSSEEENIDKELYRTVLKKIVESFTAS